MAACPFCGSGLAPGPPWAPGDGHRLAYDPGKGRLWNVCSGCSRWTLTPLESRWETLEACEAVVQEKGRVRVSTPHLSLVDVGGGELIRVGAPPRLEFVEWRYGPRSQETSRPNGFWAREPWFASPFLEHASPLTYLFSQVPLAPDCPSCRGPLALKPWDFQSVGLLLDGDRPLVLALCALCGAEVTLDLVKARPVLRIGLGLVTPQTAVRRIASAVAAEVDTLGGPLALLIAMSSARTPLGDLDLPGRVGLIMSLDEMADLEAMEAEWRRAEEMAAIMDGELSDVPGFESFRRTILGHDQ